MIMNDETWHLVKNTPRITGFLGGSANRPSPIPQKEIDDIKKRMEEREEAPRPRIEFEVGQVVRIKEGAFADFSGSIAEVNYDKNKLVVNVTIFGRATPVELGFSEVEKV
jgi:transcriptional antiterminator NusG